MASTEWTKVNGVNNADDSGVDIYARRNEEGNTDIAYTTGYGVHVVEIAGVHAVCPAFTDAVEALLKQAQQDMSADVQAIVCIQNGDKLSAVGFDDMDGVEVKGTPIEIDVASSADYEAEEFDDMEDEYPGLADAMGLAEEDD